MKKGLLVTAVIAAGCVTLAVPVGLIVAVVHYVAKFW